MDSLSAFKVETGEQKDHGFMQRMGDYVRKSSVGKYALGLMAAASLYVSDMVKPDDVSAFSITLEQIYNESPNDTVFIYNVDFSDESDEFVGFVLPWSDVNIENEGDDTDDFVTAYDEQHNEVFSIKPYSTGSNDITNYDFLVITEKLNTGEFFMDAVPVRAFLDDGSGDIYEKYGSAQIPYKNPAPVPEPGTLVLLGFGIAGVGLGILRQRKEG